MAIFGGQQQTAQITTGNVRTTYDLYISSASSAAVGTLAINNNLRNPLGLIYYDVGGYTGQGETPANPLNSPAVYKYVLYKSTTNPALVGQPGCVYYTDETFTTVSGAIGDGFTGTSIDCAGFLMPNTTDLPNLTATILNNGGLGSGVWVCVGGVCKGAAVPGSTAAGDFMYGSGSFVLTRIPSHSGTQTPDKIIAYALTAIVSSKADLVVLPVNVT